jgi:hypothetical protein
MENERTRSPNLLIELGQGLKVALVTAGGIGVGSHQHQVAHARIVSEE